MQAQLTPEIKTKMLQQMQNPHEQQQIKIIASALQAMQGQTPVFNDAGDKATYQVPTPPEMVMPGATAPTTTPVTFNELDGRWYLGKPFF
jgi:hypothetical protein